MGKAKHYSVTAKKKKGGGYNSIKECFVQPVSYPTIIVLNVPDYSGEPYCKDPMHLMQPVSDKNLSLHPT